MSRSVWASRFRTNSSRPPVPYAESWTLTWKGSTIEISAFWKRVQFRKESAHVLVGLLGPGVRPSAAGRGEGQTGAQDEAQRRQGESRHADHNQAFAGYRLSTYSATIRVNWFDSSAAVPRRVVNWRPST